MRSGACHVRSVLLALAAAAAGCAPEDIQPRWAITSAMCGWTSESPARLAHLARRAPVPDRRCLLRVLDDFAVDTEAFLEADGLRRVDALLREDDDAPWDTRLGGLVLAAWMLHTADIGTLQGAREHVRTSFLRTLARATRRGETQARAAAYDWVTGQLSLTRPGDGASAGEAAYDRPTATLFVQAPLSGMAAAALLVHEARHADGFPHRPCRADPTLECDNDPDGAYGFQRMYLSLARVNADASTARLLERWELGAAARIEPDP